MACPWIKDEHTMVNDHHKCPFKCKAPISELLHSQTEADDLKHSMGSQKYGNSI